MRIFFCTVVILFLAPNGTAQEPRPKTLSTVEEIAQDFQAVPCKNTERQDGVRALFAKAGAEPDALKLEKVDRIENLTLRLPGTTNETIVIGAHYDFVDEGCGAVDNWSGIVAISHLYRSIRMLPHQKTILFVAFGKEELGLLGSRAMVSHIPKEEVSNYCAMVNVDSFGLAQPFALENASSAKLMALAKTSAASLQLPFYTARIDAGTSDSGSFIAGKIPGITLSGLSQDWQKVLHSRQDQAAKVNPGSVYLGYRLALLMWSQIDAQPCAAFR
jgi:hypothetical protein